MLIAAASILVAGSSPRASAAAPSAPTALVVSGTMESQLALSWAASSGATGYNIYRSTSTGKEASYKSNVSGTTYEDSGLPDGTTYYYKVTAVNGGSESAQSPEASAVTKPPPPSSLTAVAGDSKVVLSWPASATATGYEIYRDTLGGVGGAAGILVTGTTYTDTGLVNGTTYYYQMSAINGSGETTSQTSPATAIPTAGSNDTPAAPANVVANAGNAKVVLTWSPATNATSYQIFRGTSSGTVTTSVATVTRLTYSDSGLTNGTAYYYLVKAINSKGQNASAVVSATPYIPAAPDVTATGSVGQIVVSWPATPSTSYAIYRGVAPGAESVLDSGLTGNCYTDAGMSKGGTFYYRVVLSNAGGTGAPSDEVSATATATSPTSWTGTVNFGLANEPVQSCAAYIPDTKRPIQGALVITFQNSPNPVFPPNLQAVAQKYNLMMFAPYAFNFGTAASPLYLASRVDYDHQVQIIDWRWPYLSAQRIQAMLTSATTAFPAHPEIKNTGIILYGFSAGTDHVNCAASPSYNTQTGTIAASLVGNRILAVLHLTELDEALANPLAIMDNVPHLFLSAGLSDGNSTLNALLGDYPVTNVTEDGLARGLSTNQGAPLTTVLDVGGGHGANEDYLFNSLWLDCVLSQRLPATLPTSAPVNFPSWQNTSSWVGTYNVSTTTSAPWGSSGNTGIQMTSNLVSPRSTYTDSRPFTWLPSQNMAATWLAFANSGNVSAFYPTVTSPITATAAVGGTFQYQITATNNPSSFSATGLPVWLSLNSTTGIISSIIGVALVPGTYTIHLSASNSQGTGASTTLTLTVTALTTMTYSQWIGTLNFTGAATAFSQNDGVSNLMKYVCDINPTTPMNAVSRAALPQQGLISVTANGITTSYITLTFRLNPLVAGVIIQPQSSPDLRTWAPWPQNGVAVQPDYVQTLGTDDTTINHDQIVEVGFKVTGTTNRYIRLNVTIPN